MTFLRFLINLGVVLLQLISTQVVTFVFVLFIPDIENFQLTHSALFAVLLGAAYTTGVFLTGWLALKLGWLRAKPKFRARLVATLTGAYLPLMVALILYHPLEPGNPFFFVSMLTCVLGFYIPGWIERE